MNGERQFYNLLFQAAVINNVLENRENSTENSTAPPP